MVRTLWIQNSSKGSTPEDLLLTRLVDRDSLLSSAGHRATPPYIYMLCSRFIGLVITFYMTFSYWLWTTMQFQCDCHAEKMVAVSRAGTDDASRHDQGVEVGRSLQLSTEGCPTQ